MKNILKEGRTKIFKRGDGGQTFLLTHKGKRYILRKCSTKKEADFYSSILKRLRKYDIMPKLYYQDKKNLILEYIQGRHVRKKDTLDVANQVGKICGIISKLKSKEKYNINQKFDYMLNILLKNKIINKNRKKKIKSYYIKQKKKINPKSIIDINDVHSENFKVRNGKVYFVDIEAIKPRIKGRGIIKALKKWFTTKEEEKAFLKGYNSTSSSKFLTPQYKEFLTFYFFVTDLGRKVKDKKKHNKKIVNNILSIIEK